jgi:copper chaperone
MSAVAELTYTVAGMTCGHCVNAVSSEIKTVPGVREVSIDLDTKFVVVSGDSLDDAAIRAAIDEAGYEAS